MAEVNLPEPKTRLEQYWKGIYDKASGGGGGGDQEINYTVSWDGYTSGRAKSPVNGVPFVQISDYYPKIDGTTQAEVEASVAEWIVDPVITLSTRGAGTLTLPATLSVATNFDEGGLMDWVCYWIISLGDSSETPVLFAHDGIVCIDLELASSILGSDIINVKLTWHRTGQLMPGECGFRIVSTSPLTLDVLNRAAAVVENRIFDENGTFPPRPYSVGYGTVTVDVPNPNYVETIEGTLANPWGDKGLSWFIENLPVVDLTSSAWGTADITAVLSFVLPNGTHKISGQVLSQGTNRVYAWPTGEAAGSSGSFMWRSNGASFTYIENSQTIEIPQSTPCTLTIIHHPLPSGS